MAQSITDTDRDRELKARHRAMWASGDYPGLANHLISSLGTTLVEACGVRPGTRLLDVATGAGNAAIPAALTGAEVTASDLTPELFDSGKRQALARGVSIDWREADAEALPFDDGAFDTVISCVGVMFTPHHREAANELVRVCAPGGTIGLLNWTSEGFIGRMFAIMRPFSPPPAPGSQPPPLWGDEQHVRELFGDRVTGLTARRQTVTIDGFDSPDGFRLYFKTHYGPTIATYRAIADDPQRIAELDRALVQLAESADTGARDHFVMEWEYLLVTATRA